MELVKLEAFTIDRDVFIKGSCEEKVKFVRVVDEEKATDLISTVKNKFVIDVSCLRSKHNYYLEVYNLRKVKLATIKIPELKIPNRILKVSSFTIGKDRRLNIECSGNIFRVQVISGKRTGPRAGLTNNKISYYIGDLIRSKDDKTNVIALDELENVLDEVEVEVKSACRNSAEQIAATKLELVKLYNCLNNFEEIDYKSVLWNDLVKALSEVKYLYDSLDAINQKIKIRTDK
ncbi:hypothetical protein H6227_002285 [Enterococcus faecalis]|nr:hypothetical protein [Enterococcus faecalis]